MCACVISHPPPCGLDRRERRRKRGPLHVLPVHRHQQVPDPHACLGPRGRVRPFRETVGVDPCGRVVGGCRFCRRAAGMRACQGVLELDGIPQRVYHGQSTCTANGYRLHPAESPHRVPSCLAAGGAGGCSVCLTIYPSLSSCVPLDCHTKWLTSRVSDTYSQLSGYRCAQQAQYSSEKNEDAWRGLWSKPGANVGDVPFEWHGVRHLHTHGVHMYTCLRHVPLLPEEWHNKEHSTDRHTHVAHAGNWERDK